MHAAILLLACMTSAAGYASTSGEWWFKVYLDEKEIGYHHYRLTPKGDTQELLSEARFDVTLLTIPVYSYRHNNREIWSDDCLLRITSSTDSDGEINRLEGADNGDAFIIRTEDDATSLPGCVASFAYWNRSLLYRDRLLNPQTGEYIEVQLEYLGKQSIPFDSARRVAHRYRLKTDKSPIELWYSDNNRWLALESTVAGDRSLRYVVEQ
jgi:hypothetical protein